MLAPTPPRLSDARRSEHWTCPNCALTLTLTHDRDGTTIGYDIEAWARRCLCPERDGPLACPSVERELWAWLSPTA